MATNITQNNSASSSTTSATPGPLVIIGGNADTTFTASQSGSLIIIPAQTVGGHAYTIPTPVGVPGLRYTFIAGATLGQIVTITPAAGACFGVLANVPVGGAYLACINKATIQILAAATYGTSLEMVSDGTNYIVKGFAPTATSWA